MQLAKNKIRVRKGFNINLDGEADRILVDLPESKTYGISPDSFFNVIPKMLVKESAKVKKGSPLFFSKNNPRITITSPVSGSVTAILRGEKRKIIEVIITSDNKNESETFETKDYVKLDEKSIKELLLKSGSWPFIRQRPYNTIASPEDNPKSIFISSFSTLPLSFDYNFCLKNNQDEFQLGVNVLKKLTLGKVFLAIDNTSKGFFDKIENVEKIYVEGPHPAGNSSVHIHNVDPINYGEKIWTVNPEDVVNIGIFFKTGIFSCKRTLAIVGSSVKNPKYYNSSIGTSVKNLIDFSNIDHKNSRLISGDILSGKQVGPDNYIDFYSNTFCAIPEGDKHRFFGWIPFVDNFIPSMHKTSLSWIKSNKKKYKVDTNLNGEERALVVTGEMEKVFPLDIFPMQLIKACLNQDIERMEALGIYEIIPEDFGLIDYGSTSKIEAQKIIKEGIELMLKEVG